jgi:transposase
VPQRNTHCGVWKALLLQAFYTVRSERQLMEQLDYNLLFR